MNTNALYSLCKEWLASPTVGEELKAELRAVENDPDEIKMRFGAPLSFGTAGLRGLMGAGIGYMNIHTVAQATRGLAEHLTSMGGGRVAIAYDTRNNSALFARVSAEVLAASGITCYLFDGPRPTPELSFAVRHFGCLAGINITASHNPKRYNGYKAYGADGAQLSPDEASAVAARIKDCPLFEVPRMPYEKALAEGYIVLLGKDTDEAYMKEVLNQRVDPEAIPSEEDMALVYTPLHGAGATLVPEVLRRAGLKTVLTVDEQMLPSGDFPTVTYPNPEFPEAFILATDIAKAHNCDLIIATDPDADRMGIQIRVGNDYVGLTGNQVGCLLLDYILTAYRNGKGLPEDAYVVKSIVTSELASRICQANGVKIYDVLTGFRFIGEVIKRHEKEGKGTYLLGFEESYGYLKGTYARDKDAVVAALLVTEMAAHYRSRGMTLKDALDSLYERYGAFDEAVLNLTMDGVDGKERMAALMEKLRACPPKAFANETILTARDYKKGTITDLVSGTVTETGLPPSDVLYYTTDHVVLVVRPSGTEPKVKVYFMARGESKSDTEARLAACREDVKRLIEG